MNIEEKVKYWYENEKHRVFIISGFAGCGKTYTAKGIPEMLDLMMVSFLAPTGKAARVLHDSAQTIHSYLYMCEQDKETGELHFLKKPRHEFFDQLLIVDEISMVNDDLMDDLRALNIPIIGLGDSAQLKPVNGDNSILDKPDIFLTKVYRNGGGILELATDLRNGEDDLIKKYDSVYYRKAFYMDIKKYDEDSIVICRFNSTRQKVNKMIRKQVYNYDSLLETGEKLMILNNDRDVGLFNGSIVELITILYLNTTEGIGEILVKRDDGFNIPIKVDVDILLGREAKPKRFRKKNENKEPYLDVDYAYAITCHKSQGSEYEKVFLINQGQYFDDHQNWLYTAATRAKKKLYIYK